MFFRKRKSDDRLLLSELYEKNKNHLFFIAYRILGNENCAEDAVHTTVLKVMNYMDKIRGFNDFERRNYLAVICRNVAFDLHNENTRIEVTGDAEAFKSDEFLKPEDYIVDRESYSEIVEMLNSLTSNNIIALKLYRVYKHSVEEISDIMGISVDNAYKRIQRGKKELSGKIEERKCRENV